MSELEPSDKRTAFVGMIVTSVILFVFAFTIVKLTNAKFEGSETHAESSK